LYGIETVSLRYFNVYGPRQDPSSPYSGVISIFMSKAAAAQTPVIYGDGNQSRDFIYVKDVVEANMLAASAPRAIGQTINVGTGRSISIQQLWSEICNISGFSKVPDYQPARAGDILDSLADTGRMHSLLRFTPGYSLSAGLRSTFDWYQGQSQMAAGRSERKKK
jgi:UDP-glucose 4-epimerase